MRQYLLSLGSAAALLMLISQPVSAQDDKKSDKDKVKQYDEIIIRKKSDKDGKVTIEIKDGQVTVNGKKLEDYDDANLSVRKRSNGSAQTFGLARTSPFRQGQPGQSGGGWSYGNDLAITPADSKAAFLGVATGEGKDGATIDQVTKGSAAEKAGLQKGDVIIRLDEVKVFSQDDVSAEVKKHKPEDKVVITYKRDGKEQKATATLGKRPGNAITLNGQNFSFPDGQAFEMPNMDGLRNFNFDFDNNDAGAPRIYGLSTRPRLGIKAQDTEEGKGVKVLEVGDESTAEKAGIKEGDIITEFDGKAVNSADELAEAARDAKEKASVTVKLKRDGKDQTVEIKTPKKLKTANL